MIFAQWVSLHSRAFIENNVCLLKRQFLPSPPSQLFVGSTKQVQIDCQLLNDLICFSHSSNHWGHASEHHVPYCFGRRSDCLCSRLEKEEPTHWRALIFRILEVKGLYCNLDVSPATQRAYPHRFTFSQLVYGMHFKPKHRVGSYFLSDLVRPKWKW